MTSLALSAVLAVACVVGAALPFLREPAAVDDDLAQLSAHERAWLDLEEERDRALEALKELESDHRAGRIGDEDYRAMVGLLRGDAARALRALDALRDGGLASDPATEGQSDSSAKIL